MAEHKVFDILSFSLTHTERGLPVADQSYPLFGSSLTECRYFHILSTFYEPVWQLLGLFNVVYSQNNMLLTAKLVIFVCSVISHGKVVALDR